MQVAFYKGRTRLFNRLVSWYLRGVYSHCELVLWTNDDGFSTCASASFMDGGVRMKSIKLDPDHWDVIDVSGSLSKAVRWVDDHEECRYDILGLLGFVWRRTPNSGHRWFCSEAVAAMLGMPEPWRFDPMALYSALTKNEAT